MARKKEDRKEDMIDRNESRWWGWMCPGQLWVSRSGDETDLGINRDQEEETQKKSKSQTNKTLHDHSPR